MQAVVSDFESALWSAVSKVLPGVHHRGCAFHFCQALWRSIQGVGLQAAYLSNDAINRVCWKTMALPFLPENVIVAEFEKVRQANSDDMMAQHLDYVQRTWLDRTVWQTYHATHRRKVFHWVTSLESGTLTI